MTQWASNFDFLFCPKDMFLLVGKMKLKNRLKRRCYRGFTLSVGVMCW